MITLSVNGRSYDLEINPDTPLLLAVRETIGLKGTKFGCGRGLCGACTLHLDGRAVRSCIMPAKAAVGAKITTIEGLSARRDHPVQRAWIELNVPQCGYCQPGMIMSAAALLAEHPQPSDAQVAEGITNLCRCATYHRVKQGVQLAAKISATAPAAAHP